MILRITDDITRVNLRIRDWPDRRYLADWESIQLVIMPGQADGCGCCHTGGSPWFLYGCWPGKRTGVDVANPAPPDFPAMCINAFEIDDNGALTFILPPHWHHLPHGRYTGLVQYAPMSHLPLNLTHYLGSIEDPLPNRGIPPQYLQWPDCNAPHEPPPPPPPPKLDLCVLAKFDIDRAPRCLEHIIDQVGVEFSLTHCEEDV